MAYGFSPVWNGTQFFDNNGKPLNGGRIYIYQANSFSIQLATYSESKGVVANTNPIILNSSGRLNTEIWLDDSKIYNFLLTDNQDNPIDNVDNVSVSSGGGGGITFPLQRSDLSDTANNEIMWVDDKSSYPQDGDSRIRGTDGYDYNLGEYIYQSGQLYLDPQDGSGESWAEIWEVYKGGNPCCYGGPQVWPVMHIPHLDVETLSGFDAVTNLSTGYGLTASSPTGYVQISKTNPANIKLGGTTISTTETQISTPNGIYLYQVQPGQVFRATIRGTCTAVANGAITSFNVRIGFYASAPQDSVMASFNIASAATGSNVPFEATLLISFPSLTSQLTTMALLNQGTTGIAGQVFTGASSSGSYNLNNGGFMTLWAVTNSANVSIVPLQCILEEII